MKAKNVARMPAKRFTMGAMRLFTYGTTSFSHWLAAPFVPGDDGRVNAKSMLDCEPTAESLAHLERLFPHLPRPFHLSAATQQRRPVEGAVKHLCIKRPAGKAFCRVGSGVYASSPELCFVQLAAQLSFHELIRAGNALCGSFHLNPAKDGRLEKRKPLTTRRRIEAFVRANPGLTGAKKARRAVPWIADGAASPPEAFLAMVLGLPFRHGGFQVAGLKVNQRIRPTRKARAIARRETLVPDLLLAEARLAIEYDSTAEHAAALQLTRDAQKRLALEADRYKVITVTTKQLASRAEMERIAKQIYRYTGQRFRPQSQSFAGQQALLFRMGWSLDGYWRASVEAGERNGVAAHLNSFDAFAAGIDFSEPHQVECHYDSWDSAW